MIVDCVILNEQMCCLETAGISTGWRETHWQAV